MLWLINMYGIALATARLMHVADHCRKACLAPFTGLERHCNLLVNVCISNQQVLRSPPFVPKVIEVACSTLPPFGLRLNHTRHFVDEQQRNAYVLQ